MILIQWILSLTLMMFSVSTWAIVLSDYGVDPKAEARRQARLEAARARGAARLKAARSQGAARAKVTRSKTARSQGSARAKGSRNVARTKKRSQTQPSAEVTPVPAPEREPAPVTADVGSAAPPAEPVARTRGIPENPDSAAKGGPPPKAVTEATGIPKNTETLSPQNNDRSEKCENKIKQVDGVFTLSENFRNQLNKNLGPISRKVGAGELIKLASADNSRGFLYIEIGVPGHNSKTGMALTQSFPSDEGRQKITYPITQLCFEGGKLVIKTDPAGDVHNPKPLTIQIKKGNQPDIFQVSGKRAGETERSLDMRADELKIPSTPDHSGEAEVAAAQ